MLDKIIASFNYKLILSIIKSVVSISLSVAALLPFLSVNKQIEEYKKNAAELPEGFTLTAHAGAILTLQNTVYSLRQAMTAGADIVEIDISFRPDGTPVIIHNGEPGKYEGVLLSRAFAAIAEFDGVKVNLDLKSRKNLPALYSLVCEFGLNERVFFTGLSQEGSKETKLSCPGIAYYINDSTKEENKDLWSDINHARKTAASIKNSGAIGINTDYKYATPEMLKAMHEAGLLVSCWTVNKRVDIYKIMSLGVDNITTKKLLVAQSVLQDIS